jgi:glutathione S-transferase
MITIYGIFGSPFVRALRIALDEKGLPWAWSPFQLGEQTQEPYLSRQPFGKIPAIEDDGFPLYETGAMLRHIDRKTPEPALIPADPKRAARMDQIMCIVDNYLFRDACGPIGFNRLIAPRIGLPVKEEAVAAAVAPARRAVTAISKLHAGGAFLTGDGVTLADIAVLPHLDLLNRTPEGGGILADFPVLTDWIATMNARPSVRASGKSPDKVLNAA